MTGNLANSEGDEVTQVCVFSAFLEQQDFWPGPLLCVKRILSLSVGVDFFDAQIPPCRPEVLTFQLLGVWAADSMQLRPSSLGLLPQQKRSPFLRAALVERLIYGQGLASFPQTETVLQVHPCCRAPLGLPRTFLTAASQPACSLCPVLLLSPLPPISILRTVFNKPPTC